MEDGGIGLTPSGARAFTDFGIDVDALTFQRRPLCRACIDWSERRRRLAESLGQALFARITDLGWARRLKTSRTVHFPPNGEHAFLKWPG